MILYKNSSDNNDGSDSSASSDSSDISDSCDEPKIVREKKEEKKFSEQICSHKILWWNLVCDELYLVIKLNCDEIFFGRNKFGDEKKIVMKKIIKICLRQHFFQCFLFVCDDQLFLL